MPISDPETGEPLSQPGFLSAATGPDGAVYVAWEHGRSSASGAIEVAWSGDGGRTWAVAPLPGVSAYAFEPSIAVDDRSTVGVTLTEPGLSRGADPFGGESPAAAAG